jgi:adenosylhomocysteine nucleosidase
MGPLTYQGSASTAIIAKSQTGATALICLGMAFGVDRATQKHGDVLVSRLLFHYDNREVECGENGEIRTNYQEARFEPKTSILGVLEQEHARRDYSARVQFGALLTGGAKIRCARFRDELAKPLSEFGELVIGGEMEGAGLVAASQREDPSWIVVKGISDFADHLRDEEIDQYRPVACANSARFVLSALKNYSVAAEE